MFHYNGQPKPSTVFDMTEGYSQDDLAHLSFHNNIICVRCNRYQSLGINDLLNILDLEYLSDLSKLLERDRRWLLQALNQKIKALKTKSPEVSRIIRDFDEDQYRKNIAIIWDKFNLLQGDQQVDLIQELQQKLNKQTADEIDINFQSPINKKIKLNDQKNLEYLTMKNNYENMEFDQKTSMQIKQVIEQFELKPDIFKVKQMIESKQQPYNCWKAQQQMTNNQFQSLTKVVGDELQQHSLYNGQIGQPKSFNDVAQWMDDHLDKKKKKKSPITKFNYDDSNTIVLDDEDEFNDFKDVNDDIQFDENLIFEDYQPDNM